MLALAAWLVGGPTAKLAAQYLEERGVAGLSRTMQMAIRHYDQGRDAEAMDGFMEILAAGDPSERNMANEYINLITHRMYTGSTLSPKPNQKPPAPATVMEPLPPSQAERRRSAAPPMEVDARPYYERAERLPGRTEAEPPRVNKAVMKKEIDAKIRSLARSYLSEIESYPDIRVLMADRQHPRALGIPAELLFDSGIVYKKGARKVLENLAGLTYCLGATHVAILPEGTVIGDAKILDMRRTMAISASLYAAGVAPPRVRVNLLNSQIDIPKGMVDFRGIILVFIYNQPLTLTADSAIGDDGGPPVSLGVWPEKFRADRGEGAIIEFSVVEPAAGLASWKFQLRQPGPGQGSDLVPLQEVVGAAPVFHQIYWNGRRNYFGPELTPGRYEIVLTSTDGRNRTRTLHRWVTLDGVAPAKEVAAAPASPATPPPAALEAERPKPVKFVQLQKKPPEEGRKGKGKKGKGKKGKAVAKKPAEPLEEGTAPPDPADNAPPATDPAPPGPGPAAPPPDGPPGPGSGPPGPGSGPPANPPAPPPVRPGNTVIYKVGFEKGSLKMAADADRTLTQVLDPLRDYPLANLNVVGYASPSEPVPEELAKKRANAVSGLLVNRYSVDPKRIQIQTNITEDLSEVQIYTVNAKE